MTPDGHGRSPTGARESIGPYRIVRESRPAGWAKCSGLGSAARVVTFAIKLLHRETAGDPRRQRRLVAEGRAASALNHPNIVRVYDADVDGSFVLPRLRWLEGTRSRRVIARAAAVLRGCSICRCRSPSLAAAHAAGIVHRDSSPRTSCSPVTAAHACRLRAGAGPIRALLEGPRDGRRVDSHARERLSGTPAYMSPEQAVARPVFPHRSILLRRPHVRNGDEVRVPPRLDGGNHWRRCAAHDEPRPIAEQNPRVPAPVRWTIGDAWRGCWRSLLGDRRPGRELRFTRDRLAERWTSRSRRGDTGALRSVASPVGLAAAAAGGLSALAVMSVTPESRRCGSCRSRPIVVVRRRAVVVAGRSVARLHCDVDGGCKSS